MSKGRGHRVKSWYGQRSTRKEARRIQALVDSIPPGKRNTPDDPYWVRAAVRYWEIRLKWLSEETEPCAHAEAARRLAELEPLRDRYAREGWYERSEEARS